jgi:hypothetical protein
MFHWTTWSSTMSRNQMRTESRELLAVGILSGTSRWIAFAPPARPEFEVASVKDCGAPGGSPIRVESLLEIE